MEYYQKKAVESAQLKSSIIQQEEKIVQKEEFIPASKDDACPEGTGNKFLRQRKGKIVVNQVGRVEINAPKSDVPSTSGWHCDACSLSFMDSNSYLDHVNSKSRKKSYLFKLSRPTPSRIFNED